MRLPVSLAVLVVACLALRAAAQAAAPPAGAVDYLWLGVRWESLPKFPGDVGLLSVSFYVSEQHVDVTVSLFPLCRHLSSLESARMPSAGPGVVKAVLKVRALALNVTCPSAVQISSGHRLAGTVLASGMTRVEYEDIYVPPYPTANITVLGAAYLAVPGTVALVIEGPHAIAGQLVVRGQGARILSPPGPVRVNGTRASVPVTLVADSPSALLSVAIESRDWLGSPVTISRDVPVPVLPAPPPVLRISPEVLRANTLNRVNATLTIPVAANGTALITVSGAAAPLSSITVPVTGGRGSVILDVYPIADAVTLTAQVTYHIGGIPVTDRASVTAAVRREPGGLARVDVHPARLVAGAFNNVTITVAAPGRFNVSVSVLNAASSVAMPYRFSGINEASGSLPVIPLSGQPVALDIAVSHERGVEQYTVTLPVLSSSIFIVTPRPSLVRSGENCTVNVTIMNAGDVTIRQAVITISPASASVAAPTYTFRAGALAPLESITVPVSFAVPASFSGTIAFTYTIVYTVEPGVVGTAQGTFHLQALQVPVLDVVSVSITPAEIAPGAVFYISATVANRGFVAAGGVQAEARTPRELIPVAQPVYFIGQLDPQQTASASFSFRAARPGRYSVMLVVTYYDQYGGVHAIECDVTVLVSNATLLPPKPPHGGAQMGWGTAAGATAVAAAAALAITLRRRKRK
jgi:hypothetical protein